MINHVSFFKGFKYPLTSKILGEYMLFMVFYKQYNNIGFYLWTVEANSMEDAILFFVNKAKEKLGNIQCFYITPAKHGKWVDIKMKPTYTYEVSDVK